MRCLHKLRRPSAIMATFDGIYKVTLGRVCMRKNVAFDVDSSMKRTVLLIYNANSTPAKSSAKEVCTCKPSLPKNKRRPTIMMNAVRHDNL